MRAPGLHELLVADALRDRIVLMIILEVIFVGVELVDFGPALVCRVLLLELAAVLHPQYRDHGQLAVAVRGHVHDDAVVLLPGLVLLGLAGVPPLEPHAHAEVPVRAPGCSSLSRGKAIEPFVVRRDESGVEEARDGILQHSARAFSKRACHRRRGGWRAPGGPWGRAPSRLASVA